MGEDFISGSRGVAAQIQEFVVPALRKVREERGTHCVSDGGEIKGRATRREISSQNLKRFRIGNPTLCKGRKGWATRREKRRRRTPFQRHPAPV